VPFQGPVSGGSEAGSGLTQRGDELGGGLHPARTRSAPHVANIFTAGSFSL
jgi:hypothetical protein